MKRILAAILFAQFAGCAAPIVKKPTVFEVKKLAIVSIYSNSDIYDVKSGEAKGTGLAALKKLKGVVEGEKQLSDESVQLSTHALQQFADNMQTSQWQIVKPSTIIQSKAYKNFVTEMNSGGILQRAALADWSTPPGMTLVPFTSIAGKANTRSFGDDPTAKIKARLAQLSKELNVDGVAVIEVDLAYKSGMLSGMSGTGLFSGVRGKATPSVSSAMIVVTSKGEIAAQTPHIVKGGGSRSEAKDTAPMLLKGTVDLSGEDGQKSIQSYSETIKDNATQLKEAINKELQKS